MLLSQREATGQGRGPCYSQGLQHSAASVPATLEALTSTLVLTGRGEWMARLTSSFPSPHSGTAQVQASHGLWQGSKTTWGHT